MSTKHTIAKDQETPLFGFHWVVGVGAPAVIVWLDGRCIIAGLGTRAAAYLEARGAIAVGMLRFARDPAEGAVPGACVLPVAAGAFVETVDVGCN